MLTDLQKKTAQGIINIFETGTVEGDYSNVTLIPGDTGGLTYGRSQTTLNCGGLFELIKMYCEVENAEFANKLRPYLTKLQNQDQALNHDGTLKKLLQKAGGELVMQKTQDIFFDQHYWNPSIQEANRIGITTALGIAVVFDGFIHGSFGKMRDRTTKQFGSVSQIGEKSWVKHYIDVRRAWLASCAQPLPTTVYRMDAFKSLIAQDKWDLTLPLIVCGQTISKQTLPMEFRRLRLRSHFMRGQDVRELQQALNGEGAHLQVDGIFGSNTDAAVKKFQCDRNLQPNGIVSSETREALGLGSRPISPVA